MAAPVTIPGDVVAHVVDIGVHLIEVGCIAIITWLVYVGKKEFFEAIDRRAQAAAGSAAEKAANLVTQHAIAPIMQKLSELEKWDLKHEQLDETRHDEIVKELKRRRPSASFGD